MLKRNSITLALSIGLLSAGCASMQPIDDPKILVPAHMGMVVGKIAGIPLDIVALPITLPLSELDDDPNGGGTYIMSAPSRTTAWLGGSICALPPLLLFGWWGQGEEQ